MVSPDLIGLRVWGGCGEHIELLRYSDSFWVVRVFRVAQTPAFRVWGGYRELIQLLKYRGFVL
jgi:hypothetical protein